MTRSAQYEVVSFLRRPGTYGADTREVSLVETHMSWVFLTDAHVYKLKKAIRQEDLDLSTPALRHQNCLEEIRLNRRLASDVYLGALAVTREADSRLALAGAGEPVDWLVQMRRLPGQGNLEAVLRAGRVAQEEPAIRRAAWHLARFFAAARPVPISPAAYRKRLVDGVRLDCDRLLHPRYRLPHEKVDALAAAQLRLLDTCATMFDRRIDGKHIVEGHGDLRPEHIWLIDPPAIIDCVEFDSTLRTIDAVDDLAFLFLECERFGQPQAGRWFLEIYTAATGDDPPPTIFGFYRVYRALRRATIAARHLDDPAVADPSPFLRRACDYLDMVEPLWPDATCVT